MIPSAANNMPQPVIPVVKSLAAQHRDLAAVGNRISKTLISPSGTHPQTIAARYKLTARKTAAALRIRSDKPMKDMGITPLSEDDGEAERLEIAARLNSSHRSTFHERTTGRESRELFNVNSDS